MRHSLASGRLPNREYRHHGTVFKNHTTRLQRVTIKRHTLTIKDTKESNC